MKKEMPKKKEDLELPGEMTDLRYLTESLKFLEKRVGELRAQKQQINVAIDSAEGSRKHMLSIFKKVKQAEKGK